MKKIIFTALIVVLSVLACSKNEQTAAPLKSSSVQDATIPPTKITPTALQLSQDYNFKSLLKISEGIAGNSTTSALDAVKQVDAYGRHYLSNAQYVALAKGLGYTDTLCFRRALDQMVTYATALNNRYYLTQDVVGAARQILYPYFPSPCTSCYTCYTGGGGTGGGTGGGGNAISSNPIIERTEPTTCCQQAMITYTFRIGECFGLSIIGGSFTPVGAGVFLGCGCVAAYGLHLDRKACGGC